jgi:hypothetical protein
MSFDRDGFLSEQTRRYSHSSECRDWFLLGHKLNRAIHRSVSTRKKTGQDTPTFVLIHLLYFRALSNFQGALLLADRGLIVEARALARCLVEVALSMVGVKSDPKLAESFVAEAMKSRRRRANMMLNWDSLDTEQRRKLVETVETIEREGRFKGRIEYADIARKAGCEIYYVHYSQLSTDAAHASADSLNRYVNAGGDGKIASLQPFAKLSGPLICETIERVCDFLFVAISIYLQFAEDPGLDAELAACLEQYRRLAKVPDLSPEP